ncbi:putative ribonuclease H-like domain-containing protein [Tanacetum coccineum]
MSSTSKVGLGYEIKSNDEVLSYEEEMNRTVFNCTEEDYVGKPLYNRFSKTDNFKGVPHPLTGDYTPKPQQEIDESLYVYGKKGPQKPKTSVSDDTISENSVTTNEKVMSEPIPKEVEPSCVIHVKTPRQPMKNQGTPKVNRTNRNEMMERELGDGYSFIKKKVFCLWSNVNTGSFNVNTIRTKQPVPTSNSNSFSSDHPLKNMEGRGIFDSGCSRHMTSNNDHLDDFEECKGGSVTFGGSKGYKHVWILVDLPYGAKVIGTKWVYKNKRDERGVVVRNWARLVGQGHRQEEGIDYDKVFAPVARIEAIRLFLAFSSFMRFIVYKMDVQSAFLYGIIDEEVYVSQPPSFVDPVHPKKVYKVVKALYGLHQAPKAWTRRISS